MYSYRSFVWLRDIKRIENLPGMHDWESAAVMSSLLQSPESAEKLIRFLDEQEDAKRHSVLLSLLENTAEEEFDGAEE